MNGFNFTTFEVLLVEDAASDVRVIKSVLEAASGTRVNVNVTSDGEEAVQFLRREGGFKNARLPHIIILDLNMPKMNGCEVLAIIKADEKLNHIPVVVLTTSNSKTDIRKSYKLGCSAFITKPIELGEFRMVVEGIKQFWSKIATPPPSSQ